MTSVKDATREMLILSIVDDLLERISEQALMGDAELLSDLAVALNHVVSSAEYLRDG